MLLTHRIASNAFLLTKPSLTKLCSLFSFQYLAHDTDFSSPLPRYEFQGVLSDVWLPIEVPKVGFANAFKNPFNKISTNKTYS